MNEVEQFRRNRDAVIADWLAVHDRLNVASKAMEAEPVTQENSTLSSITAMMKREADHILELLQQWEDQQEQAAK